MIFKITVICSLLNIVHSVSRHPILIIVSYDAFRYNFFETKLVPNMERLKKVGTYADYLINVFPTKTFPNHHSIATGLYTETHGIVGNSYFDTTSRTIKRLGSEMFSYNKDIIPIWKWNEDQGNDRYSASMMWPGAIFPYQGKNITHIQGFDPNMDWFQRADMIISWLMNPDKPANLVMFYVEEPDTHGHAYGPNAPEIKELLQKLDNLTAYLEDQLDKYNLAERTNVIHMSDHGLVGVTPPYFINMTQYMKYGTYDMAGASPCLQIYPKEGHEQEIYDALKAGSLKNGHFKVYQKKNYPKQWHYKKCTRSPPILVMADVGYALDDYIKGAPEYAEKYNFTLTNSSEFGVHGYDYNVSDMHPFFMARGPKIKKQHKVAPFHTVDLFNLFTQILEIPPLPNNGSMGNIVDILNDKQGRYSIGSILMVTDVINNFEEVADVLGHDILKIAHFVSRGPHRSRLSKPSLLGILYLIKEEINTLVRGGVLVALLFISVAATIALIIIKRQQTITTAAALNKRFPQTFHHNIVEAQHLLEPEDA
ncbi:bis(5'-adenosyl)-triphosphatase enpp4-like isoform X2 [Diabrotica virgifera virgifera]|uniref:Ectonucleotide pyrophosphatase/phosphodiesterase family member 5-like n=1 Tax=Diabrotica virgifera virgifera TaxID=50390 RepID=A0ABM5JTB4_DIAVI|nr:bis(5'-adenosyl)-triphosphatase enpp4-like isoform X2 [Diabrotica virgifera virgifera]